MTYLYQMGSLTVVVISESLMGLCELWADRKGLLWGSERHSCWSVLEQLAIYVPTSSDILNSIRDMPHIKYVTFNSQNLVSQNLMFTNILLSLFNVYGICF